jgi:FPC/CPF motif-containing protein YcgG
MIIEKHAGIVDQYHAFIGGKDFPCVAARAALARDQVRIMVCDHIACPKDDRLIAKFIHSFVDEYRSSARMYNSAVVIFEGPIDCTEEEFDSLMWLRLQGISDHDSEKYKWDHRVSNDPSDPNFSFSIGEEAFYVIGLHPGSTRRSRKFQYPAIVFNPHHQFEELRRSGKYAIMKDTVRKRDVSFSGSVNPMLADFGQSSEVYQYSGRVYDKDWKCPFVSNHERDQHHSAT